MITDTTVVPTKTINPFRNIEIRLFGKPKNWSISPLQSLKDACDNPVYQWIDEVSPVRYLCAPRPSDFNARIVSYKSLEKSIFRFRDTVGNDLLPKPEKQVTILRGTNADGVDVPRGYGYWVSSADCPTIIALSPLGRLGCAHAGLKSTWDSRHILRKEKPRKYSSVVNAISNIFYDEMPEVFFYITCGIKGKNFKHPWNHEKHGRDNQTMTKYFERQVSKRCVIGDRKQGCIDLKTVIYHQLIQNGASPGNITFDDIDTYSDTDEKGEYLWWSNRRAVEQKDGTELHRNGVLVFRNS